MTRQTSSPIARAAELVRLGIDDLATVKSIHAACVRVIAAPGLTEAELAAFDALIKSIHYSDRLAALVRDGRLLGLRVGGSLVAVAGWSPSASTSGSARLDHVCTLALFGRLGLGSRLVVEAERDALIAGFHRISVRTFMDQIPFFERLGFTLTSHSAMSLTDTIAVPVAFMRKAAPAPRSAARQRPH